MPERLEEFEKRFAARAGTRCASLVNSGSSANLLALTALTSHKLQGERLAPGDEVITVAAGFPTTVNPIRSKRAGSWLMNARTPL